MLSYNSWLFISLTLGTLVLSVGGRHDDKVRLSDVEVLTLIKGEYTNGRRGPGVPQLHCLGGTAGCSDSIVPKVVQCTNRGSDGHDIQWECKAALEPSYKFGRVSISCEGYDDAEDDYMLRGSCGLEYELDLNWRKEPPALTSSKNPWQTSSQQKERESDWNADKTPTEDTGSSSLVVGIVIILIIIIIIVLIGALWEYCTGFGKNEKSRNRISRNLSLTESRYDPAPTNVELVETLMDPPPGTRITSGFGGTKPR